MGDPNLSGDPNNSDDVQRIKRACEIVRRATLMRKDPNYPGGGASVPAATLTVVYIPYHPPPVGKVPKPNEPNCAWCQPIGQPWCEPMGVDDPRGGCFDAAEIALYKARIAFIKTHVAAFNVGDPNDPNHAGKPVDIGQQFFNDERWATAGFPSWDNAVTAKHDLFYNAGQDPNVLPGRAIYWYERGGIALVDQQGSGGYNPIPSPLFALDEKGDAYSVSIYQVWDLDRSRESMRRTAEKASNWKRDHPGAYGTGQFIPWVGLACGFPELGYGEAYEPDMDYGLGAARDMGAMLRVFAADPNDNPFGLNPAVAINQVALYPEPFSQGSPRFTQYFVEYVRGFTD